MKLFAVIFVSLIFFASSYPHKQPIIIVKEVSSEENEIELDHPWTCGTDALSLLIAEGTIDKDCPAVKNQVNNCCFAHDNCYDDQHGRDYCDDIFCECLQTATVTNQLCHEDDAHVFCNLVRQFGESAYNASGHLNSTEVKDIDDPLADLIGTGEALNQTSHEYYDYEKSERTIIIRHQRERRTFITEIISDPVINRLVKTPQ